MITEQASLPAMIANWLSLQPWEIVHRYEIAQAIPLLDLRDEFDREQARLFAIRNLEKAGLVRRSEWLVLVGDRDELADYARAGGLRKVQP